MRGGNTGEAQDQATLARRALLWLQEDTLGRTWLAMCARCEDTEHSLVQVSPLTLKTEFTVQSIKSPPELTPLGQVAARVSTPPTGLA